MSGFFAKLVVWLSLIWLNIPGISSMTTSVTTDHKRFDTNFQFSIKDCLVYSFMSGVTQVTFSIGSLTSSDYSRAQSFSIWMSNAVTIFALFAGWLVLLNCICTHCTVYMCIVKWISLHKLARTPVCTKHLTFNILSRDTSSMLKVFICVLSNKGNFDYFDLSRQAFSKGARIDIYIIFFSDLIFIEWCALCCNQRGYGRLISGDVSYKTYPKAPHKIFASHVYIHTNLMLFGLRIRMSFLTLPLLRNRAVDDWKPPNESFWAWRASITSSQNICVFHNYSCWPTYICLAFAQILICAISFPTFTPSYRVPSNALWHW